MKRKLFCLLLTSALVFCGASCAGCAVQPGNTSSDGNSAEDSNPNFEDYFAKLDMSYFSENGYTITFLQKYSLTRHTDNEEETADLTCEYEGTGSFTLLTEPAGGDAAEGRLDLFRNGRGYLDQSQREKAVYKTKETDKVYGESRESTETVDRNRYFRARFDEKTLYTAFRNEPDGDPTFEWSIEKDLLSDLLSDELLDRFVDGMIFVEGYSYLERLSGFSSGTLFAEESLSEEEMEKYTDPGDFAVRMEDEVFTLEFSMYGDAVFDELKENPAPDGSRAKIRVAIQYDTAAGQIVHFRFDLKEFLLSVFRLSQKEGETVNAQIDEFAIEGDRLNVPFDKTALKGNFTAYTDAAAFLEKLGDYTSPTEGTAG
ncbi:MAG: hypothetical protein ILO68_00795 [Clostridia bacterium]|nr:hypothetical protein [Clostridia bacterium]